METFVVIILLIFGLLIGMIGSIAGIGGGALYMSLMILMFSIPINEARDTSTFTIFLFSGAGFISYYRHGKVDLKLSLTFAGFALLGSITATIFFILFPIDNFVLKIIIASVVLVSGLNMIRKAIASSNGNKNNNTISDIDFSFDNYDHKLFLKKGMPLFFLAGFVAYLSGIGGGMVFVPILSILCCIPIHFSTAISVSMIFFINIYNATARMVIGDIHYLIGILLGIGAITGSMLGAKISNKIPKNYLQYGVATVLVILAIRMYFI
ncbi:MAG: sulfite exporter TauE/SafE family protein [Promethearchaeota archaeon]